MISFAVSKDDTLAIVRILKRAEEKGWLSVKDRMSNAMDLQACIAQGCPLDLERMEAEIDGEHAFSVAHDLGGIRRHIDRNDRSPTGGQLLDCFVPRFRKREPVAV